MLALTSFSAEDKVFAAIKAGAMGYLLKDCDSDELLRAVHQVQRGESSLHPKVARMLLQEMTAPPGSGQRRAASTPGAAGGRSADRA